MSDRVKVLLIRHGKTPGNIEKRYIGKTDESLDESEKKEILSKDSQLKHLLEISNWHYFISPMKRCKETLELLTGKDLCELPCKVVENLKECDFGTFEGKNYKELTGNESYQKWIDSNGEMDFPEGEGVQAFKSRCQNAFLQCMKETSSSVQCIGAASACFIVHGGTIMSICEKYAWTKKGYYDYQIGNLDYLEFEWDGEYLR